MTYEAPEIIEIGRAEDLVLGSFGIKIECTCGGCEPN